MTATVFDNDMVAHVWAQQRQHEGRSHNGNFYFSGATLYSYGTHYPVGVFAADGTVFLNSDHSTRTTEGKHKNPARRAVNYKYCSAPALDSIIHAIRAVPVSGVLPADCGGFRAAFVRYLAEHWKAFPADDSDEAKGAAWMLRASGSRRAWGNVRAEHERKADAAARISARNAKRHAIADGKRLAAVPLDMLRLRMIQTASNANDWNKERQLNSAVSEYADAHRASEPGKTRDALWARVKLARELRARFLRHGAKALNQRRGAIATLRRIWAGDYGANVGESAALNVALAERGAIREALGATVPAPLRNKSAKRLAELDSTIAALELEREAARMAEQAAERAAWLAGAEDAPRRAYHLKDERGGALIRALGAEIDGCNVTGGTLETSQGATVPLPHAVRAFAFVRAIRERGEAWERKGAGIRVGHFTLDSVSASGDFVAGCHRINWNETERLARELGVWDCPAIALGVPSAEDA